MKCRYKEEILNLDMRIQISMEKMEFLKTHIKTCEECRNAYTALFLLENHVQKEVPFRVNVSKKVLMNIDPNYYKKKRPHIILNSTLRRIKPVLKTACLATAVFLVVLIFIFAKANLLNHSYYGNSSLQWNYENKGLIDENGNIIQLKGIMLTNNVWGNWEDGVSEKLQKEGKNPMVPPSIQDSWVLTEDDFNRIKALGVNCVGYGINYQLFSKDNIHRVDNIKKLKSHIARFNAMKIYTVVSLLVPPGQSSYQEPIERMQPGNLRTKSVFEDTTYYHQWVEMWKFIATELSDAKGLAGYDILYQPRIPSLKEGGTQVFEERMNGVCEEIRKIDEEHILFVQEYRSREANEGEIYFDSNTNKMKEDSGEQGIIWMSGFVKIHHPNIVYTFSFYDPFDFTYNGKGSFDKNDMEATIKQYVSWAKRAGNVPLLSYYSIARVNSASCRTTWIETANALYKEYKISAIYSDYKSPMGSYIDSQKDFFSLFGQYNTREKEIQYKNSTYLFINSEVEAAAKKNGFDVIFNKYFDTSNQKESVSLLDNKIVLDSLKKFWKEK